jgi:PAS domain-containing protein
VPVTGRDELARLAASFNAMGDALQDQRDELDSQNAELEQQTAELEEQQSQLSSANDELRAQRDELERITASLADETERQRLFGEFGETLAAFAELEDRARTTLRTLVDTAGAQVGALYAADAADADRGYDLLATLGLERDRLPERIRPDTGLAGRALAERQVVQAGFEDATLQVGTVGGETAVRHELHVPLLYGDRTVGVVSLGRTEPGDVDSRACDRLDHLADQAAVSLANAFVTKRAQRLGDINRAMLDSVRDGILLSNAEGVVLANAPARRLTEEILGVPFEEAAGLDPTQVAARTTDAAGYLAANEAIAADPDEPTFDEVELADSGRVFERYTAPVRGADGERVGRTTVIREVTAEREAERAKNELMATVSHELRTPLASIVGFTELLLMRDPDPEMRHQALETVHREANRLSDLIDDFLDLQRIESGRMEVMPVPTRLAEVVAAARATGRAARVHLFADVGNLASQAVARRAGFTAEGVVRSCLSYRDGTRGDAVLFGRLAGE